MNDFYLPRPEATLYDQKTNSTLNAILDEIKTSISANKFEFIPKVYWSIYEYESKIKDKIREFGWDIEICWHGSKEDGHAIVKIKPLK